MIDWRDRISIMGAVIISVIVVTGFGGVCLALFFFKVPPEMKELAMLLLGVLAAGFTSVVNYWTGSNSGSQKKDAIIAAQATGTGGGDTPGMKATMTAQVSTPPKKGTKP